MQRQSPSPKGSYRQVMSHQDGYQGVGKPVRVQISHSQHHQVHQSQHQPQHQSQHPPTQQHQPQNSVQQQQPASNHQKFQQIKPTNHNHPPPDQWSNEPDEPDIEYGKIWLSIGGPGL